MRSIDRGDDEFERALLRSASRDAPDAGASERAWRRFAAWTAGAATTLAPHGGVFTQAAPGGPIGRFARVVATAKWLIVGALGGSAMTLALVGGRAAPPVSLGPTSTVRAPSLTPAPSVGLAGEPTASTGVPSTSSASPGPRALARRDGQGAEARSSRARGLASAPRDEVVSLAAEVAALDVARRALDAGAPDDALTVLRRYLRDFPKGALLPEAQVMRIEALAAKGDRAGVASDASRFLARYPSAPQRTRVEQLRDDVSQK